VLHNFSFEEFDNMTARVTETELPIFQSMDGEVWDLNFKVNENEKLAWEVVHYENRNVHGDEHGISVMTGTVGIKVVPVSIYSSHVVYLEQDVEAYEFIQTLFTSKVTQLSYRNVFGVCGEIYDFDNMTFTNGFIDFEFILDK
jgi:hypothetical protein